jgi:hypothetical protein
MWWEVLSLEMRGLYITLFEFAKPNGIIQLKPWVREYFKKAGVGIDEALQAFGGWFVYNEDKTCLASLQYMFDNPLRQGEKHSWRYGLIEEIKQFKFEKVLSEHVAFKQYMPALQALVKAWGKGKGKGKDIKGESEGENKEAKVKIAHRSIEDLMQIVYLPEHIAPALDKLPEEKWEEFRTQIVESYGEGKLTERFDILTGRKDRIALLNMVTTTE